MFGTKKLDKFDKNEKNILIAGALLVIVVFAIFFLIIPGFTAFKRLDIANKEEQKTLNYIIKYSHKIALIKLSANKNNKIKSPNIIKSKYNKKKGYIKFLIGVFRYLKIRKSSIKRLDGTYKKREGKNVEIVSMTLKGLALNQIINIIYNIKSFNYSVNIESLKIYKNFNNKKLLNLNAVINRKIPAERSNKTSFKHITY